VVDVLREKEIYGQEFIGSWTVRKTMQLGKVTHFTSYKGALSYILLQMEEIENDVSNLSGI
jgi:hypothetical protein